MKLKTTLLLALAFLPLAGHSSEYDNRARAAAEEAGAKESATEAARIYKLNSFAINKISRFAAQHGGLTDEGSCYLRVNACRDGRIPCDAREDAMVPFTRLNPASDFWLQTCTVNLRDGLACQVYESFHVGKGTNSTWYASCYDGRNQKREFNLGFGIGLAGKAWSRPAAKKRKK